MPLVQRLIGQQQHGNGYGLADAGNVEIENLQGEKQIQAEARRLGIPGKEPAGYRKGEQRGDHKQDLRVPGQAAEKKGQRREKRLEAGELNGVPQAALGDHLLEKFAIVFRVVAAGSAPEHGKKAQIGKAQGQKGLSVQITPPGITRRGHGLPAAQQGQGGHIEAKKSHLSDSFVNLRQVPDGGMDVQPAAAEGLADSLDAVRRSAAAEQTLRPGSGVIRRQEVHPACHGRLP